LPGAIFGALIAIASRATKLGDKRQFIACRGPTAFLCSRS